MTCPRCRAYHDEGACCRCAAAPARKTRGGLRRCYACDRYLERHGTERPPELIVHHLDREVR